MDLRNSIVNTVVEAMASLCDAVALSVLEKSLMKELAQYEVQERSTDIVVHDGSAEGLLRKFIATKRVEGKSEKTLGYYDYIIRTFLYQIDKRLYELNTFDLRYYLSMYKEHHGVSNRTLENMRKCLSSFFSWLNDERFIPYNPCRGLKRIKYDKVILARTVSTDVREKVGDLKQYDLLVFYSPFEITSLLNNFQAELSSDVRIATFGTGTAKAAYNAGLNVCVLAPTREFPSMGMAISNYIAQIRKGSPIDTSYIQEYIQEDHQKNEELIAKVKIISKAKKSVKKKSSSSKKEGSVKSSSSKTNGMASSTKMVKNNL